MGMPLVPWRVPWCVAAYTHTEREGRWRGQGGYRPRRGSGGSLSEPSTTKRRRSSGVCCSDSINKRTDGKREYLLRRAGLLSRALLSSGERQSARFRGRATKHWIRRSVVGLKFCWSLANPPAPWAVLLDSLQAGLVSYSSTQQVLCYCSRHCRQFFNQCFPPILWPCLLDPCCLDIDRSKYMLPIYSLFNTVTGIPSLQICSPA